MVICRLNSPRADFQGRGVLMIGWIGGGGVVVEVSSDKVTMTVSRNHLPKTDSLLVCVVGEKTTTRMHSSMMHTVCCSGRPGGVCPGGVCPGVCVCPGGCLPRGGGKVSSQGGCLGVSAHGGCLPRGCIPACTEADPPSPWKEFLTHSYENITLPQLRIRQWKFQQMTLWSMREWGYESSFSIATACCKCKKSKWIRLQQINLHS